MKKKVTKHKILKVFLLSALAIVLAIGIFLVGKKVREKKEVSPVKIDRKTELEKELQQLENQLQKETNSTKKQELEQKKKDLEQEIQNLGGSNNPPNLPPNKTHRQFTVKYNTEVGGKHEYIDINDNQKRILIATKNKIFSSASDLTSKDNQYNFSFYEGDATEFYEQDVAGKKTDNFVFDTNNDKFQLTSVNTPSPQPIPHPAPGKNPNPNQQIEIEVKWGGGSGRPNYWLFMSADWPKTKKRVLISKKHSLVKGKKMEQGITPKLKITFAEKDVSQKLNNDEWLFTEDNNKFTLTPLTNWPDDPNYEIEEETILEVEYGGTNYQYIFFRGKDAGVGYTKQTIYRVPVNHPELKKFGSTAQEMVADLTNKTLIISFINADELKSDINHVYFKENNNSLEIKVKS